MSLTINDLRARYNAKGNAIIPNTFQHPNIFVDRLMYYLSPIENVVLDFAVRRILGFQDNIMSRKDNISLSQFTDGITAEDGHCLSMGCGLGIESVRHALDGLEKFKVLLPTSDKPDPRRGQEYWLQDNENSIDWEGLEKRKEEWVEKGRKRTKKARYAVGQYPAVGQKSRVLSDRDTKPTETHLEEEEGKRPEIFIVYEQEIAPLTPNIANKLIEAEAVHTGHWVCEALKIASANGKRNWSYADAILIRWKAEGYGSEFKPTTKNGKSKVQTTPPSDGDTFMEELEAKKKKLAQEAA